MSRLLVGALLLGVTATVTSAQAPPPLDTSGWKIFRDATMGFEVKAPPSWGVGRTTGTMESVLLGERALVGKPTLRLQLIVQRDINPSGLSIDQWYADQLKRLKVSTPPPSNPTVLGGRRAIRREMTGAFGKHFDFYTTLNKSDIFQVSIIQDSPQEPLDPTFDAVISTIKFVE